jgi:hypothetical protein
MPVVEFRVASRTELGRLIKGSEWQYKVYDYGCGGKYQRFERESRRQVSEKVHHLITGGPEDEAWRTDQCTAKTPSEGARGVQIL